MSVDLLTRVTMDVVRNTDQGKSNHGAYQSIGNHQDDAVSANATRSPQSINANDLPTAMPSAVEAAKTAEPAALDKSIILEAVSGLQNHVQNVQRELAFSVDDDLNRVVITVYDSETDEVVRQIPSEEVLALAKNIDSSDIGLLLEEEV